MTDRSRIICDVLVVEDNPDDFELTRLAFADNGYGVRLHRAANGQECMDYLRRQGLHAAASPPDMVLLDINMPVMDGYEVMKQIAANENLRHLPVIVLTTSSAEDDILSMYRLRCSAYVVKPADFNEFTRAVRALIAFWCWTARLPQARPGGKR